MDNLHHLSETLSATRPGIVSFFISIFSAVFALLNTSTIHIHFHFFAFISLQHLQSYFAIGASCVAMISGGFAIYYYKLQIKKAKQP